MDHPTARRDRRYVVALWLVIALLVAMAVTVPFALASFLRDFGDPGSSVYSSNSPDAPVPDHRVSLDISEMDEVGGTFTLLATAARVCDPACFSNDQVIIRSLNVEAAESVVPAEVRLTFDATADSTAREIVLPLYGNFLHYPFDVWTLSLKVSFESAAEGDAAAPDGEAPALALSVTSRLPRMEMYPHEDDAATPGGSTVAAVLEFKRPAYLRLLTIWMILSIAAIAACVVFLSPVDALIGSAAGLVLAVWGIRGILLGTLIPASSAVDSALALVVVFVLIATLVRIGWLFESRSQMRLRVLRRLPGAAPAEAAPPVSRSDPCPPDFRPGPTSQNGPKPMTGRRADRDDPLP
jgi:hypothetical protein